MVWPWKISRRSEEGQHIYSRGHDTNKPSVSVNGWTASGGKIHFFVLSTGISRLASGVQEGSGYRCGLWARGPRPLPLGWLFTRTDLWMHTLEDLLLNHNAIFALRSAIVCYLSTVALGDDTKNDINPEYIQMAKQIFPENLYPGRSFAPFLVN